MSARFSEVATVYSRKETSKNEFTHFESLKVLVTIPHGTPIKILKFASQKRFSLILEMQISNIWVASISMRLLQNNELSILN